MEQVQTQAFQASDHTEALSRDTTFDDGASHKMTAKAHVMQIQESVRVNLTGLTGGDAPGGLAF